MLVYICISWLNKPADILLYAWRGDRHYCVDLVSMSPSRMGWQDATFRLFSEEHGKSEKHARSCISHGFDFSPFGFLTAAKEMLDCVCRQHVSNAHIPPVGGSSLGVSSAVLLHHARCS